MAMGQAGLQRGRRAEGGLTEHSPHMPSVHTWPSWRGLGHTSMPREGTGAWCSWEPASECPDTKHRPGLRGLSHRALGTALGGATHSHLGACPPHKARYHLRWELEASSGRAGLAAGLGLS